MQIDISSIINNDPVYVNSIELLELLETLWLNKNFPDRPGNSSIDIYNPRCNNNYVLRGQVHTIPFVIGKYEEKVIELTEQQTAEYKVISDMFDIFYK